MCAAPSVSPNNLTTWCSNFSLSQWCFSPYEEKMMMTTTIFSRRERRSTAVAAAASFWMIKFARSFDKFIFSSSLCSPRVLDSCRNSCNFAAGIRLSLRVKSGVECFRYFISPFLLPLLFSCVKQRHKCSRTTNVLAIKGKSETLVRVSCGTAATSKRRRRFAMEGRSQK